MFAPRLAPMQPRTLSRLIRSREFDSQRFPIATISFYCVIFDSRLSTHPQTNADEKVREIFARLPRFRVTSVSTSRRLSTSRHARVDQRQMRSTASRNALKRLVSIWKMLSGRIPSSCLRWTNWIYGLQQWRIYRWRSCAQMTALLVF